MIIIYILGGIIAIFLMYILFLFVCSLFVRTDRQYTEDSRFYRHLLYGATGFAMWFLRVKMHVTGMEKIPVDVKPLFVGNQDDLPQRVVCQPLEACPCQSQAF